MNVEDRAYLVDMSLALNICVFVLDKPESQAVSRLSRIHLPP